MMQFNKIPNYIFIVLLGWVSFLIYLNSLPGDFLIDDYQAILGNPQIHDIKVYLSRYFSFSPGKGAFWELAHAIIWHLSGPNPYYYHLFNVLVNSACVILVFILCNCLFANRALSFLTGLIFALHPIHSEAVSWISGGSYAFSGLFFIAAFIFYVKSERSVSYLALAVAFFGLCLFAGNAGAATPIIFALYDLFFRKFKTKRLKLIRILVLISISAVALLLMAMFLVARNKFIHTIFYFRGPSYLIVVAKALVYYLKILYLPLARGLYHPFAYNTVEINKLSPAFFLSLAVIFLSTVLFFKCRKAAPPVSFGLAWFFATYLPYSNIVPICNIISERYMYLPSLGFAIITAYLFLKAWEFINQDEQRQKIFRHISLAAITLYLGSYAILTLKHNYEYRNLLFYWQTNIRNFPDGYKAYNNLAGTYYAMGNRQQAIAYCWVNLMINPRQPHVWCNLGKVYKEEGRLREAQLCYAEALKIDKDYFPARQALEEIRKEQRRKAKKK